MSARNKVFLIVVLGVGACLLSSILGHHFAKKSKNNQRLLSRVQQLTEKVENIRLLSGNFIQNTDPDTWQRINQKIESLKLSVAGASPAESQWGESCWISKKGSPNINII